MAHLKVRILSQHSPRERHWKPRKNLRVVDNPTEIRTEYLENIRCYRYTKLLSINVVKYSGHWKSGRIMDVGIRSEGFHNPRLEMSQNCQTCWRKRQRKWFSYIPADWCKLYAIWNLHVLLIFGNDHSHQSTNPGSTPPHTSVVFDLGAVVGKETGGKRIKQETSDHCKFPLWSQQPQINFSSNLYDGEQNVILHVNNPQTAISTFLHLNRMYTADFGHQILQGLLLTRWWSK